VSHSLSRRLNNATGQYPVVCPSHIDNDGTVAYGVLTARCPIVCPVVPSLFRPTGCTDVNRQMVGLSRVSMVKITVSVRIRVRFSFSGVKRVRINHALASV